MEMILRTIFQSQEVKIGEKEIADVVTPPETLSDNIHAFTLKRPTMHIRKKSVSFHGVEAPKVEDSLPWSLQLKRSSASTNVSAMNLAESDKEDSSEYEEDVAESDIVPPTLSELEDDGESGESLCQGVMGCSGLVKAKDSIINLKDKNSKLSHRVHHLKTECTALCENLEHRQDEVEELDRFSGQLQEKLKYICKNLEEVFAKQEALKELEHQVAKNTSSLYQGLLFNGAPRSEKSLLTAMSQTIFSLYNSFQELQLSLETTGHKTETGRAVEKQEMMIIIDALDEIRSSMAQFSDKFETASALQKDLQQTVFCMNTRIESFLSRGHCAHKEQELLMDNFQEMKASMESSHSLVKKIASSYGQIRDDLDSFCQLKPFWEEISRSLIKVGSRNSSDISNTRDSSLNIIQQGDQERNNKCDTCSNCQRVWKKILEMEVQLVEKHMQAVAIGSDLRLVQDDALRLENILSRAKINTGGKIALANLKMRIHFLQQQIPKLCCSQYSKVPETSHSLP